ncbi:hypothetical protein [Dactylosporangium sp. NPDC050588]|uniref:hypothetical protein n=1 Tax=Dactylosporangium sp. NPDC050588 TaxID=3157211 RepID=UPI0033F177E9
MPRRERPLDTAAGPVQSFAAALRQLRASAGNPKYLQMARTTGRSRTALAEAAGGDHLAAWDTVAAYITACGGRPLEWLSRWETVRDAVREARVHNRIPQHGSMERPGTTTDPVKATATDLRALCIEFALALDTAHNGLRAVSKAGPSPDLVGVANLTVHRSGIYAYREQMLMTASPALVAAAETAFLAMIAVRDAVRSGTGLQSVDYHKVYHPYAVAIWQFRLAVRGELSQPPIEPATVQRTDWSDTERCPPGCRGDESA